MASNYTDTTDADFTGVIGGVTYNIEAGKNLSAAGVRNALHTKENVANKQVSSTNDTADVLDASSSDSYYPSSKLAGKNFAALRSGKQDKIAAGTANDIAAYSGTEGTFNTLVRATTLETNEVNASDEKIPTEKAVMAVLSSKASSSDLAAKQDKIEAGTANDILTKTAAAGTLGVLTKTTSIRTGSTTDTAPDDTRIPTEKAVADAVMTTIGNLSFQAALPIGTILMFDGSDWVDDETIAGWYACIAGNLGRGCPDLVNSFIKGSFNNETGFRSAGGNTGNAVTIDANNLPEHTHGLSGEFTTSEDGEHKHEADGWGGTNSNLDSGDLERGAMKNSVSSTLATKDAGKHTHTITLSGDTGNNATTAAALNIEPQSYALIFIRRCA
ncbi:hypothetical protein NO1_1034 [Candidatus Termititenax aidoneus]|uniref:Phage tail fiber protein n=1 Tax=Termititenax aidoneus TaxID=2218524 RepID=A0A388TBF6_TERA1|nr:hypothetical protein NO1_1034 [Candidatus Termititenax aidoneus]